MTSASPGGLSLEKALGLIPGFSAAKLLSQLSDGPTNASYLLELSGVRYVLRLDKPAASSLGLARSNEKQVCAVLAAAGLAPEALYFDPVAGIYLRRFLQGRSWNAIDIAKPSNLQRLAGLLRTLHAIEPAGAEFDPLAAAQRYAARVNNSASEELVQRAQSLMDELQAGQFKPALCHNDLVCQNILEGEHLVLIDWEYAGVGDPFFDLAVVIQHHQLAPSTASNFIETYLGQPASRQQQSHIQRQCSFYQCLLELWRLRIAETRL